MYLTQEMYDLILCTYFPHEVTSFTGQSRTQQKPEMLRYSNQIHTLSFVIYGWHVENCVYL